MQRVQCVHGCSLALLTECVLCRNGHRFCLKCLGSWSWSLRKQVPQNDDDSDDDDDPSYFYFGDPQLLRDDAELQEMRSGPKISNTRRA